MHACMPACLHACLHAWVRGASPVSESAVQERDRRQRQLIDPQFSRMKEKMKAAYEAGVSIMCIFLLLTFFFLSLFASCGGSFISRPLSTLSLF